MERGYISLEALMYIALVLLLIIVLGVALRGSLTNLLGW